MDATATWSGQDPTLSGPLQDDFQQFLDMGLGNEMSMSNMGDGLPFEFADLGQPDQSAQQMLPRDVDSPLNGTASGPDDSRPLTAHSTPVMHGHARGDSLVEIDAQIQYLQQQRAQQQQRQMREQQQNYFVHSRMIPPTPSSMEMHGATFYTHSDPQQQALYERYQMHMKEQEMAFTPLVSPAVTPLDAHFPVPKYTIPGAYFSPLSSPALHAQNDHPVYDAHLSGTTNSPIDLNLETHAAPSSGVIRARKPTRKTAQQPSRTARPIAKPRRAKRNSMSLPTQTLADIMDQSSDPAAGRKELGSAHSAASTEESESSSISPEHLSDMAPPPLPPPGSAGRSPYIRAQKENTMSERLALGSPATPASLMRLTQSPSHGPPGSNQQMDIDIEGFTLPEALTMPKPSSNRVEMQSDGQTTPTLSSTAKPTFQPLPSPAPSFARPSPKILASASQSPQIEAQNGSTHGSTAARQTPQMTARTSKKRGSSSVLASPALLPRISPSIKPLLPGRGAGSVAEDTASLLLASKSNYQNILEGTHLPGVSYPSELSTNLTSKRTSHKIAEQGRRNRINSALQEIATLLPRAKDGFWSGDGESNAEGGATEGATEGATNGSTKGDKGAGAQSSNSKASTVELAIEYIKQLQKEVVDANRRADEAEKKLAAC